MASYAKYDCKCCKCGDKIQAGKAITWHEITRSGGRSNGGYGSAITIKTGKFLPACKICGYDERMAKLDKSLADAEKYITDCYTLLLTVKPEEKAIIDRYIAEEKDRIAKLTEEKTYLINKYNS